MEEEKEVRIKRKIRLKAKHDIGSPFTGKMKVRLKWSSETDLDLCLFFKKKDGGIGGVFSNEYNNNVEDLGTYDRFPYMKHNGDVKKPGETESVEQINIVKFDEIDTAYVVVVNYDAAIEGRNVTYADEQGYVEVVCEDGTAFEVPADSDVPGHVYLVCSITNKDGQNYVKNESEVYSLNKAFNKIPGFSLIVEDDD